jgi:hypothetical protein
LGLNVGSTSSAQEAPTTNLFPLQTVHDNPEMPIGGLILSTLIARRTSSIVAQNPAMKNPLRILVKMIILMKIMTMPWRTCSSLPKCCTQCSHSAPPNAVDTRVAQAMASGKTCETIFQATSMSRWGAWSCHSAMKSRWIVLASPPTSLLTWTSGQGVGGPASGPGMGGPGMACVGTGGEMAWVETVGGMAWVEKARVGKVGVGI